MRAKEGDRFTMTVEGTFKYDYYGLGHQATVVFDGANISNLIDSKVFEQSAKLLPKQFKVGDWVTWEVAGEPGGCIRQVTMITTDWLAFSKFDGIHPKDAILVKVEYA